MPVIEVMLCVFHWWISYLFHCRITTMFLYMEYLICNSITYIVFDSYLAGWLISFGKHSVMQQLLCKNSLSVLVQVGHPPCELYELKLYQFFWDSQSVKWTDITLPWMVGNLLLKQRDTHPVGDMITSQSHISSCCVESVFVNTQLSKLQWVDWNSGTPSGMIEGPKFHPLCYCTG